MSNLNYSTSGFTRPRNQQQHHLGWQQPLPRRHHHNYNAYPPHHGQHIHANMPHWGFPHPGFGMEPAMGWGHSRQQTHADHNNLRCSAVKGDSSSKTAGGAALQPGLLVAFKKDERTELGLVQQPDGKKNWWIVNQAGRRTSVPLKSIILVLPGSGYAPDSLATFSAAAADADTSLLEIAWAVASEESDQQQPSSSSSSSSGSGSYSLSQMCQLLYDSETAQQQYSTFCMLLADKVYFKCAYKGGMWQFQPKDAAAVEEAAAAAAAEAAEAAARQVFLQDWAAGVAAAAAQRPGSVAEQQQRWLQGPHKERVQALLDFVMRPVGKPAKPSDELARETLVLLKQRPEPEAAVGLLQEAGLLRLHEPVPVLRLGHNAEGHFPAKLQQAAEALITAPPADPDAASRLDLSHLTVFTIDDASTRDVDDGISVEQADDGQLLLWVHVADPTRWVQPGDVLDREARTRTRSLYFPFGSVPMFPRCLSEGPFSLGAAAAQDAGTSSSSGGGGGSDSSSSSSSAGALSEALSVCLTLSEDGSLGELVKLGPSRIRVAHQLTYDDVDADLGLGPGLCQHEDLQLLFEAARLRRAWRVSQGCIDIDLPETKLEADLDQLDAATPAIKCSKISQWESAARMLVAEMMILAGEAVGKLGASTGLPLPYRGQDAPRLPAEGVIESLPEGPCKGFALRRCMTRSVVSATPVRHASLALDAYVQVTSPIRRYTDLVAHFNLKAHLRGQPPPFSASDISLLTSSAAEVSRELGRAEGDVEKYWGAEFMRQHWQRQQALWRRQRGQLLSQQQQGEPQGLPGMVLGWVRPELNLIAVSLEETGMESVIKVDFPVEPGDRLLLQVAEVDVPNGHYKLTVVDRLDVHRGAAGSEAVADDMSTADTDADADEQQQQQEEGQDADDGVSTAEGSHALVEERGSEQGDGGSGDASIPESVGGSSASAV